MNYGWTPWINPFSGDQETSKSSIPTWAYNFAVWGFALFLIGFIIVINIYSGSGSTYDPYSKNNQSNQQRTIIGLPNAPK